MGYSAMQVTAMRPACLPCIRLLGPAWSATGLPVCGAHARNPGSADGDDAGMFMIGANEKDGRSITLLS